MCRGYKLQYRSLEEAQIALPYKWKVDPFGADKNATHHFYSLRWLPGKISEWVSGASDEPNPLKIVADFLEYHATPQCEKNQYYMGPGAEHTLAIRTGILVDIWLGKVQGAGGYGVVDQGLLESEIKESVEALASDALYKFPHNHGLMVDKKLIEISLRAPKFDADRHYFYLAENRAARQIDAIFDGSGFTKEHSIIYQVYNANICVELLELYRSHEVESKLVERIETIAATTTYFMQYCARPDGALPPVGDSFRFPDKANLKQLERVSSFFEGASEKAKRSAHCFWKASVSDAFLVIPEAGFALIRRDHKELGESCVTQAFFTAGWHSSSHKQNDDLSFTFVCDGVEWIDEPGYSDQIKRSDVPFSSECYHNVVHHANRAWTKAGAEPMGSGLIQYCSDKGVVAVEGVSERLPEASVTRRLVYVDPGVLLVIDQINTSIAGPFVQRFHFGHEIRAWVGSDGNVSCRHQRKGSFVGRVSQIVGGSTPPSIVDSFVVDRAGAKWPTLALEYRGVGSNQPICYVLAGTKHERLGRARSFEELPTVRLMHHDVQRSVIELEAGSEKRMVHVDMVSLTHEARLSTVTNG